MSSRIHCIVTLALEILAKEIRAIPYSHTPLLLRAGIRSLMNSSMELITWRKEGGRDEHPRWNLLLYYPALPQPTKVSTGIFPKRPCQLRVTEGHHINKIRILWKEHWREARIHPPSLQRWNEVLLPVTRRCSSLSRVYILMLTFSIKGFLVTSPLLPSSFSLITPRAVGAHFSKHP